MSKRVIFPLILLILTAGILIASCQSTDTSDLDGAMQTSVARTMAAIPTNTPIPTITPMVYATETPVEVIQYGPTDFPDNVNPLTGLQLVDPSIMERRPVLIKVSNFPREGRPHAGLSNADLVFDYSIGEGGDRFLAVFYGQDSDNIGPVRSGRLVDRWLTSMYQGVLGMKLAYIDVLNEIDDELGFYRVINASSKSCPALCQFDFSPSAISWFANSAEMTNYYLRESGEESFKPNLEGMAFNSVPPQGGVDGREMTMHFGHANEGQWIYDPATRKYLRWIENMLDDSHYNMIPLVDRNTDQQLAFSNVIVMFAAYETLNSKDTIHEIQLEGASGNMMLFRDGQMYEGTWESNRPDVPFQFYDASGQVIEMQPGNSWIIITGAFSSVDETSPGVWYVAFAKP